MARGLNALFDGEHQVIALREKFGRPGVTDQEWIEVLSREGGWTVLSGDLRIAKKRPSRALFVGANLVGFFPLPALLKQPLNRQAARLLIVWPIMERIVGATDRGVFEIGISGNKLGQISG